MNQHRVILPIFSTSTRNNTRLLRTNRIRLPQAPRKQQPSQPQYFPQPSSQPQFKVPQAKEPREAKRKQKRTGKQPVVDLNEDDENDEMASRRSITRWTESWIEHSQDANIGKDQHEDIYWNLIMSDFNSRTTAPPRTKNMMTGKWIRMHGDCQQFNGIYKYLNRKSGKSDADLVENAKTTYIDRYDNLQKLFDPDLRERPADKQRAKKKQKSVETTSVGGSTGGCQSEFVSLLVSQDYRRKCDAAEEAYKAKKEKELGNSGGILCVWEPTLFVKDNVTSSDNFLAVMGTWIPSSSKLFFISVYAPQDLTEKKVLWDYIFHLIDRWDGDCVIMQDFNEVRKE
ncbi:hypothetical protein Tco_1340587 [Tanacetum coccineum]